MVASPTKRAPAKRTPAKRAASPAKRASSTEAVSSGGASDAGSDTQDSGTYVTFQGRQIRLEMPASDDRLAVQAMALERFYRRLQRQQATMSQLTSALGSMMDIIVGFVPDDDDQSFIDTSMLSGDTDVEQLMKLIDDVVSAAQQIAQSRQEQVPGNRQARRAAKSRASLNVDG